MTRWLALMLGVVLSLLANAARAEEDRTLVVSETRPSGVRPEAAAMVTRQLLATVARLGYRVSSDSRRVLAATLSSHDGRYVVNLALSNTDGTEPSFRTAEIPAETLETTVDGLARGLLETPAAAPPPPRSADTGDTVSVALQTEGAIGLHRRSFYNHLAGARLDYHFGDRFALGAYVGYLNAKGKDGRISNVLTYAQLEYRVPLGSSAFSMPLRFGTGYLPANGPVLRFAAGISHPISDSVRFTLDLLTPTVWIVKDSTVMTMDVAAEIAIDL